MGPDEIQIQISGNDQTRDVFQKLTKRVQQLERENAKLERRVDSVSKRVTNLRTKFVSLDRQHQTTRKRVRELTGTMKDQASQITRLTRSFDSLSNRQEKQALQIRALTVENNKFRRQLDRVRSGQNQVRNSGESLRRTNRESADEVLTLSAVWNDFAGALFSVSGLLTRVGNFGVRALREFGRAALEVDRARESFIALTDSVTTADARIQDLWEIAQLPGVTFRGALQSSRLLESVGVSADDARQLIIEFGNAIELSGGTLVDFRETLRQLAQGISRNKIQQEELNVIFERAPIIARAVKEAYGTIDPEVITAKLQEAGETAADFWRRIANEVLPNQARANIESLSNTVTNLQNAWERLKQGLGTAILPEIKLLVDALRGLTDRFNELNPETQRAIALTTAGGTFFAKFGGTILEVAANVGLAVFGINQMRGSLSGLTRTTQASITASRLSSRQVNRLAKETRDLSRTYRGKAAEGLTGFNRDVRNLGKRFGLTKDQVLDFAHALSIGGLSATAALAKTGVAATATTSTFAALGSTLVTFLPHIGIGVAVVGALALGFNYLARETDKATKETEKFEESLDRANTRAGKVKELNERIQVLLRQEGAYLQHRTEELPSGAPSREAIREEIEELILTRNFYRDSDLPEFQRRFTEEIGKHTERLDEIVEERQAILRRLATSEVSFEEIETAYDPTEIFKLFDYTTRSSPVFTGVIQQLRDLDKESENIEETIDTIQKFFVTVEQEATKALGETSKELSRTSQIAKELIISLNLLEKANRAISEPIGIQGLGAAAAAASRLVEETAELRREQANAREEERDKDKRDAQRLALEIQKIDLDAANSQLDIDRRVATQRVAIYNEVLSAIRSEAGAAVTTRQISETSERAVQAINMVADASKDAARERERLRSSELRDAEALNQELVKIDSDAGRQRIAVYEQAATQISSLLNSLLGLVTNRELLDQYQGDIDVLKALAIDAARDIEAEQIAQANAREMRRSEEEKNAVALAAEIAEIRQMAAIRIEQIETNSAKAITKVIREELDRRIALFRDYDEQRRAFAERSTDFELRLSLNRSQQTRDDAKRNLDQILADENSTTDARLEAVERYQRAAEDYNDDYLYNYQQAQNDIVAVTIETTRVQKELELELANFRDQIRQRQLANEQKLNQSIIDSRDDVAVREYERQAEANALELERNRVARREEERARKQRERSLDQERKRETAEAKRELGRRLQTYNTFYNALRNLDISSVDSIVLGLARVVTEHLASLAIRIAAERAYAAQQAAIEQGAALSAATKAGGSAGLAALISNPIAIGALIATLGISAISNFRSRQQSAEDARAQAIAETRTFHDPLNDALARSAGRRYADMDMESRSNVRRSARDFTRSFEDGASESRRGGGDVRQDNRPILIQLQVNDRTVQEFMVRADTMQQQGRLIGRRR